MRRRTAFLAPYTMPAPTIGVAYSGLGGANIQIAKDFASGSLTSGIQEAINNLGGNAGYVVVTPGLHPTSVPITLRSHAHVIGSGYGCVIRPTGPAHHAVFTNDPTAQIRMFSVRNLAIDYSNLGTPSADPADRAFDFQTYGVAPYYYPLHFTIENVRIDRAYHGYYDTSRSFMSTLSHVWTMHCPYGFHKTGGSTFHFENCEATGKNTDVSDRLAWHVENCPDTVITAGAIDTYYTTLPRIGRFYNNQGLALNGFFVEGCQTDTVGGRILEFDTNNGLAVSGLTTYGDILHTEAGQEGYVIYVSNSIGKFAGMNIGGKTRDDSAPDVGTNVGTFTLVNTNYIEISGSRIAVVDDGTNLTGTRYGIWNASTAGSIVEIGCLVEDSDNPVGGTLRLDSNDTMCRITGADGVLDT